MSWSNVSVVAILGQDADIAFAIRDLVLTGGVVGNVGIRDVLNMPDNTVEYFGDFNIGLIINRDDLARRDGSGAGRS